MYRKYKLKVSFYILIFIFAFMSVWVNVPVSYAATYGTQMSAITSAGGQSDVSGNSGQYTFTAQRPGVYKIELSGAKGNKGGDTDEGSTYAYGGTGSKGGKISGNIELSVGQELYLTFNEGGKKGPGGTSRPSGGSGGSAPDIRLGGTDRSNIILCAGGGAGGGGAYWMNDYSPGKDGGDASDVSTGYTTIVRGTFTNGVGAGGGGGGGGRKSPYGDGEDGGPEGGGGDGGIGRRSGGGAAGHPGKNAAATAYVSSVVANSLSSDDTSTCTITLVTDYAESVQSVSTTISKSVAYNTASASVISTLPTSVRVVSTKGNNYTVGISTWTSSTYNATSPGTYTFFGTLNPATFTGYLDNALNIKATASVTVQPPNSISAVTTKTISVEYGTPISDLVALLGTNCMVTMSQTGVTNLPVSSWNTSSYSPTTVGEITLYGTFGTLPSGYWNLANLKPTAKVTVRQANTISSVVQTTVTVPYRTSRADLLNVLGNRFQVNMTTTGTQFLDVTSWDVSGYNNEYTGSQTIYGSFGTLPSGYWNLNGIVPQVTVIVNEPGSADVMKEMDELRTPQLAVIKGRPFSMKIPRYLSTDGGEANGVTVINENKYDGYIVVAGTLTKAGYVTIVIDGNTFIFNVIEEPDSSNVTVTFD